MIVARFGPRPADDQESHKRSIDVFTKDGKLTCELQLFFAYIEASYVLYNNCSSGKEISVIFVDNDGEKHVKVVVGKSILEAAHENDVELEGACEGSCACSTCHVIEYYNKLEDLTDEENDMLDLAFGLTETSRLGCQIIATPELDGIRLEPPAATRNFAVDKYAKAA